MIKQNERIIIRKNYVLGYGLYEYDQNTNGKGQKFIDFNNIFLDITNNKDGKFVMWDKREIEQEIARALTTISQGIRGEVYVQNVGDMIQQIAMFNAGGNLTVYTEQGTISYNKTNAVIGDRIQFRRQDNNVSRMYPELSTATGTSGNALMIRTTYINEMIENTNALDARVKSLEDNRIEKDQILVKDGSVKLDSNYKAMDNITDFNQITDWGSSVQYTNLLTQGLNDQIQPLLSKAVDDINAINRTNINKFGSVDMDANYVPTRDKSVMTKIDTEDKITSAINANNALKDPILSYSYQGAFDFNTIRPDIARISQFAEKQINLTDRQFTKVGNDTLTYTFQSGENMSIFTSDKSIFAQLIWVKLPKPEELTFEDTFNNGRTTQNTFNGNPIDVEINTTTITITGLTTQDQTSLFNNFRIRRIFQTGSVNASIDTIARSEITRVENKFDTITTETNVLKQNKAITLNGFTAQNVEDALLELKSEIGITPSSSNDTLVLNDKVYGKQSDIWNALVAKFPYDPSEPLKHKGVVVSIVANASWSFFGVFNGYLNDTTAMFVGMRVYNTNSQSPSLDMCDTTITSTSGSGLSIRLRKMNVLTPTSAENATPKQYVDDANAAQNTKINTNTSDIASLRTDVDVMTGKRLPIIRYAGYAIEKNLFAKINELGLVNGDIFIWNDYVNIGSSTAFNAIMQITSKTSTTINLRVETIGDNNTTMQTKQMFTIAITSTGTTGLYNLTKSNVITLSKKINYLQYDYNGTSKELTNISSSGLNSNGAVFWGAKLIGTNGTGTSYREMTKYVNITDFRISSNTTSYTLSDSSFTVGVAWTIYGIDEILPFDINGTQIHLLDCNIKKLFNDNSTTVRIEW